MTVKYHPSDELLLDYASGGLGDAWSLAIATHLALCPRCRKTVVEFEAVGGALVATAPSAAIGDDMFAAVMTRLQDEPHAPQVQDVVPQPAATARTPMLPEPLRSRVGGDAETLPWQRLGLGAYQLLLPPDDDGVMARLLRIPAGRPVPTHSHRGLELTLVLAGAFFDASGTFGRGDLQEADDTLEHQPHATADADCICLAVTDAPLRFKGLPARMIQPLLGI